MLFGSHMYAEQSTSTSTHTHTSVNSHTNTNTSTHACTCIRICTCTHTCSLTCGTPIRQGGLLGLRAASARLRRRHVVGVCVVPTRLRHEGLHSG